MEHYYAVTFSVKINVVS